jgi:hypothetical protein
VRQSGRLELGDRLLDHGVAAVLGLDLEDVTGPVSDHGVVVPVGEQRRL